MTFRLMVDKRALGFLNSLEAKDQRIIKEKLKILQENPYPGSDGGDKEKLHTNKTGNHTDSMSHVRSR